jgi:Transposase DDE domain
MGYKRAKHANDFAGMAEYGVCSSKALKYFGLKLHSVVSLIGVVMGFLLTGASHFDNQPVIELLDSFSHHLKRLLGDGAYNDTALQTFLEQYRSMELLAPVKLNQEPVRSKQAQQQLNRLRHICETVNAQLQEQLHLSKHYAKSTRGLLTRIAAKLTAHSVGMMLQS